MSQFVTQDFDEADPIPFLIVGDKRYPIWRKSERLMKEKNMCFVVMVNDAIDSVWTEEKDAQERRIFLHTPRPGFSSGHVMFARVYPILMDWGGNW